MVAFLGVSLIVVASWGLISTLLGLNTDFEYTVTNIESELMPPGIETLMLRDTLQNGGSPSQIVNEQPQDIQN